MTGLQQWRLVLLIFFLNHCSNNPRMGISLCLLETECKRFFLHCLGHASWLKYCLKSYVYSDHSGWTIESIEILIYSGFISWKIKVVSPNSLHKSLGDSRQDQLLGILWRGTNIALIIKLKITKRKQDQVVTCYSRK